MLAAVSVTVLSASLQAEEETPARGRTRVGAWQTALEKGRERLLSAHPFSAEITTPRALAGFTEGGGTLLGLPTSTPAA